MNDEKIELVKGMAEKVYNGLPWNVREDMHRHSFIAGFLSAAVNIEDGLKIAKLQNPSWIYCRYELPKESGRYYVAETINGNPVVTTRRFYKKSQKWAEGRWNTARNVYAWLTRQPPINIEEEHGK